MKALEEMGVGRPSTYASIIGTIQDRGYVWKKGIGAGPDLHRVRRDRPARAALRPSSSTTASPRRWRTTSTTSPAATPRWCRGSRAFYFGTANEANDAPGLKKHGVRAPRRDRRARGQLHPDRRDRRRRRDVVVRVGRYGPYIQVGERQGIGAGGPRPGRADRRAGAPSCSTRRAATASSAPTPTSGLPVLAKAGRYGPYVTTVPPEGRQDKPPDGVAVQDHGPRRRSPSTTPCGCCTLPRVVGVDPADGVEITAQNGRYGPYIKKGKDSRTLGSEEELLTVTLDQALALFAQPKLRGRAAAAPPLQGARRRPGQRRADRGEGGPLRPLRHRRRDQRVAAQGRRRRGRSPIERAAELLADRRARGPAPKKRTARKAPAKKTAAKKSTAAKKAGQEGRQEGLILRRRPAATVSLLRPTLMRRTRQGAPSSPRQSLRRRPRCLTWSPAVRTPRACATS